MKASPYNFAEVFANRGDIQYVLPHFQREYRWEEKHWKTLWDDAMLTYDALPDDDKGRFPEHFLGALVVVPDNKTSSIVPIYRLVDGQQRLTTISLLLCALGNAIQNSDRATSKQIRRLLINDDIEGDLQFKVLPTTKNNDRAIYSALIEGKPIPDGPSHARPAYHYFSKQLEGALATGRIAPDGFFKVLIKAFQVVWVKLDEQENAYQIFESLNTKGERLGESDLVRNYIAMRLPSGTQEKIFHEVWAPIEAVLNDQRKVGRSGLGELTAFLRHYDAMQSGVLPAEKNIYARFRDEMKRLDDDKFIEALHSIRKFAALYDGLLRPDKGDDKVLRNALLRLNALDISVAYPFLLAVAARHEKGQITTTQFCEVCETLENYIVRRFLIDASTSYLNKMFAALAQNVDWTNLVPSLQSVLTDKQYPTDDRVRESAPTRALYDKNNTRERVVMLFERINRHLHIGSDVVTILDGAPTLEHILPQTLSGWWKDELGEDADNIAREWKHTLGNLTLVTQSYNSSLSNDSFPEKRAKLVSHGLRLNSDYFAADLESWDATAIRERADWLTQKVLEIWPSFAPSASIAAPVVSTTPISLTIRGETFEVKSWRDVFRQAIEYLARDGANFDELSAQFPWLIRQTPFNHGDYLVSNGWHLTVNWSKADTLKYVERPLQACGIGDDEWEIEDKPV